MTTYTGTSADDVLTGSAAADTIDGLQGSDELYGEGGNDTLNGGDADDYLEGGLGDDVLNGGAGDDRAMYLNAPAGVVVDLRLAGAQNTQGAGIDTLNSIEAVLGSQFNDTLHGNDANNALEGRNGDDTLYGYGGNDVMSGQNGNNTLYGGAGDDSLIGEGSNDVLYGGSGGDDYLVLLDNGHAFSIVEFAGEGHDTVDLYTYLPAGSAWTIPDNVEDVRLQTGGSSLTIQGNSADNLVYGWSSAAVDHDLTVHGAGGNDSLQAFGLNGNQLWGDDGNDTLRGYTGADTLDGGAGDDFLFADAGDDILVGGDGNDILNGGAGTNEISGGDGDDMLGAGVNGVDHMNGGAGNDTYYVDNVGDTVSDSDGADTVYVLLAGATYTLAAGIERGEFGYQVGGRLIGNALANGLTGNAANDILDGGDGGDTLYSYEGNDTLIGGAGDDLARGGIGDDTLSGGDGADDLGGEDGNDTLNGGAGADWLSGGNGTDIASYEGASAAVTVGLVAGTARAGEAVGDTLSSIEGLRGSAFADMLAGDAGTNILQGGLGGDTLDGGAGADRFVYAAAGDSTAAAYDTLLAFEHGVDEIDLTALRVTAVSFSTVGTQTIVAITLLGGGAMSIRANGTVDLDDLLLTPPYNEITGTASGETINGTDDDDSIAALGGDDIVNGAGGADILDGGAGNDTLDGGAGADRMTGGTGDDVYLVDRAGDTTVELAGEGADEIRTALASFDLSTRANIERLAYTGTGNFTGTGNTLANLLTGGAGNDTLDGGAGNDTMQGGAGSDSYWVDAAGDVVTEASGAGTDTVNTSLANYTLGANLERLAYTGIAAFAGTGNASSNQITGGAGADTLAGLDGNDTLRGMDGDDLLDGGAGSDAMYGGAGDDVYVADSASDVIGEMAGAGEDSVRTGLASYVLGAEVERLVYTGAGAFAGTGNALTNLLTGGGGNDTLAGLDGNDVLEGGAGNDALDGGEGNDTASYAGASAGVTIRLDRASQATGGAGTDSFTSIENVTGSSFADVLTGNSNANILDGGVGADEMRGGQGEDVYWVDNAGDKVVENNGDGSDLVYSSVTWSLAGQYIEVLELLGAAAINGTGNGLANRLVGNSAANVLYGMDGNDRLDGQGGADTMRGGMGNDTYVVDNAGDVIQEDDGQGTDTVEASIGYSLVGRFVEVLVLTGAANINGTGNGLANTLIGNSGNNVLNGMGGADSLRGGAGDDVLIVDNAGDTIVELNGEGYDTVQSSVTFSLAGQYADALVLTGSANINGTGNGLANVLTGNSGANLLRGGAGDDHLHGGLGSDTLAGEAGADHYWFETALGASNVDTISGFVAADDTIHLDRSIFAGIAANGTLAAGAFRLGTAALDADDRILYDSATGNLWYDADGAGGAAAALFAKVTPGTALSSADFVGEP